MKIFTLLSALFSGLFLMIVTEGNAQPCDGVQQLSESQLSELEITYPQYEAALEAENLSQIDLLSDQIIEIFGDQAGLPESEEQYASLTGETAWLDKEEAVALSRLLIDADADVYSQLWKAAKGMRPPDYPPHSLFLRAAAEISVGLLKIAAHETDQARADLYTGWALRAMDSLATMQVESGAFPFPDLRPYGDPVFSEIIQNFLNELGDDSLIALQDGWIVDDFGTGELKFDSGVCGGAFADVYEMTEDENYKNTALAAADYLLQDGFNANSNYNTFSGYGMVKGFDISGNNNYITRAADALRYAVLPLQIPSGRWADGHNSRSVYRSIIIERSAVILKSVPDENLWSDTLKSMLRKATADMTDQGFRCGASTGFRWLLEAYQLGDDIINPSLKDSMEILIGRHIRQAAVNGAFLDVYTMGLYFDLLDFIDGVNEIVPEKDRALEVYPLPFSAEITVKFYLRLPGNIEYALYNLNGRTVLQSLVKSLSSGIHRITINTEDLEDGVYILRLRTKDRIFSEKIIKVGR